MSRFSLVRLGERPAGDSGPMSQILDGKSYQPIPNEVRPRVGCGVRVGSYTARTYEMQDYWQTTPVTKILKEGDNYVLFETKNSTYEWRLI
jgi:hypothetical protein